VRNAYETAIGHFNPRVKVQGAAGAELIDPKMRQSTDFPGWLQVWRAARRVAEVAAVT
jgi:predicted sulfurtransferase